MTDPLDSPPGLDARRAPRATLPPLQTALLAKVDLESAMLAAPADQALRHRYFGLLARFAAGRSGLGHALLPELGHPLYFRCGTHDVANLTRVFHEDGCAVPRRATPGRILLLGAHAGYAAVHLARRFPDAALLCVEPLADNFRLLTLNTAPYRRILRVHAAAWHTAARLGVAARDRGDWRVQLHDRLAPDQRTLPAHSLEELLRLVGWKQAELIVCDIAGSERAVFANPASPWLRALDALVIDLHDDLEPGCDSTVSACFDPAVFDRHGHGDTTVFERRVPFRAMAAPPPRELLLLHDGPGLFPLTLHGVAEPAWGFFLFEGSSCQVHPNAPGAVPARVAFPRTAAGQSRFVAVLHHAGHPAAAIRFSVRVEREDGGLVGEAAWMLEALSRQDVELDLPPLNGRHRVLLQTEMAPAALNNYNAWARWIMPRLV